MSYYYYYDCLKVVMFYLEMTFIQGRIYFKLDDLQETKGVLLHTLKQKLSKGVLRSSTIFLDETTSCHALLTHHHHDDLINIYSSLFTTFAPILQSICLKPTTRYSGSEYKGIAISLNKLFGRSMSSCGACAKKSLNSHPPLSMSFS
jgi:hypothetical protein